MTYHAIWQSTRMSEANIPKQAGSRRWQDPQFSTLGETLAGRNLL